MNGVVYVFGQTQRGASSYYIFLQRGSLSLSLFLWAYFLFRERMLVVWFCQIKIGAGPCFKFAQENIKSMNAHSLILSHFRGILLQIIMY